MNAEPTYTIGNGVIYFVVFVVLGFFLLFIAFMWFGWIFTRRKDSVSPYTGLPLRRGKDLSYASMVRIYKFMSQYPQYDNRMFKVLRSAVCRETGRIFPNCITWYGSIRLDWTFLQKRCRGTYVSWGSLSNELKNEILKLHGSLDGYQTEFSCPNPVPSDIEGPYIYTKPGPLYVDIKTGVLIGWKTIPDSQLEALIVQRPIPKI